MGIGAEPVGSSLAGSVVRSGCETLGGVELCTASSV